MKEKFKESLAQSAGAMVVVAGLYAVVGGIMFGVAKLKDRKEKKKETQNNEGAE